MRAPDKRSTFTDRRTGRHWSAWKVPTAESPAALACWLLHCPGVHAVWSYWMLGLVHLRSVEGLREARKAVPGAEYELHSVSILEAKDPDNPRGFHFLSPIDFVHQFAGVTDVQATEIVEGLVDLVIEGKLAPDSDYARRWRFLLDAAVARHVRPGSGTEVHVAMQVGIPTVLAVFGSEGPARDFARQLQVATGCPMVVDSAVVEKLPRVGDIWGPAVAAALGAEPHPNPPAFTCPACRRPSWNLGDGKHRWCSACQRYFPPTPAS